MSYRDALEAAGAVVHNFEQFGSYQGDWYAKVTYQGRTGFVEGSYGSCSGCDAFEAEFGYENNRCQEHTYDYEGAEGCEFCVVAMANYQTRLADFGRSYLDNVMTFEEATKQASNHLEWDMGAQEMVNWLKANQ